MKQETNISEIYRNVPWHDGSNTHHTLCQSENLFRIVNFQHLQLDVFCYQLRCKPLKGMIAFQWYSAQLRKRKLSQKQISPFVLEVGHIRDRLFQAPRWWGKRELWKRARKKAKGLGRDKAATPTPPFFQIPRVLFSRSLSKFHAVPTIWDWNRLYKRLKVYSIPHKWMALFTCSD